MVVVAGERYLMSMLGAGGGWVQNVQTAGGNVTLHIAAAGEELG